MFFILSKTLNYLVMPFVVVCICFLLSVLLKNPLWRKRCFWTGFTLLFFFSNDFIANELMMAWEPDTIAYADMPKTYEWGIVLTGATESERKPADRVYFSKGADRVTHTIQLYKLGLIKKIMITGGSGRLLQLEEKEAVQFRDVMLLMGVSEDDILIEANSRNTHENALEAKKMVDSLGIDPSRCLLITSAFHMRRSIACFRKVGMDIDFFTTDFHSHPRHFTPDVLLVPRVEAILTWHKLVREWTGIMAYKLAGYV